MAMPLVTDISVFVRCSSYKRALTLVTPFSDIQSVVLVCVHEIRTSESKVAEAAAAG